MHRAVVEMRQRMEHTNMAKIARRNPHEKETTNVLFDFSLHKVDSEAAVLSGRQRDEVTDARI